MDVLNNAKAHFLAQVSGELRYVDVPEWGDESGPARIYYKPMTLAQKGTILRLTSDNKHAEAMAETLIERAFDEDGKRMFKKIDRSELMSRIDPEIIFRIVGDMNDSEVDDLGK